MRPFLLDDHHGALVIEVDDLSGGSHLDDDAKLVAQFTFGG